MHLLPNELRFGVAPEILLDCARQIHGRDAETVSLDEFSMALGAATREAQPVLEAMAAAGFFAADTDQPMLYRPTSKLGQLALANISNGLTRETAGQLLQRVIDRARLINSEPGKYACEIRCLVVFGSYLTDKPILGDLDLGVEFREIRSTEAQWSFAEVRRLMRGGASPASKVMSALRLQKPKQISIHRLEEVIALGTPYEIVFGTLS